MFPEHFYFTGAGWLGYFLYLPMAILGTVIVYWLVLRRFRTRIVRYSTVLVILLPLVTFPLWDAVAISQRATKLCEQRGGLHVYRTVNADSFLGGGGIEYWSRYGFRFLEIGGSQDKKYRLIMKESKEIREEISDFESQYQVQTDVELPGHDPNIRGSAVRVKDRITGEVLGELVKLTIYPSWFDRFALNLLPVEFNPWICGNEAPDGEGSYSPGKKKYLYGSSDVIKATIKPKL